MPPIPDSVAIVGLGPSLDAYVSTCRAMGGRHRLATETWAINGLGDVLACDRIFHMDDVRIQQIRAEAAPESNIAAMLDWMRTHPGPIYTSKGHPDYPGLVDYPLEDVINVTGHAYFNSTFAYALAFAVFLGVKTVHLFGADFTYPNAHHAERGRACVEYWMAIAAERGINVVVPETSSLLDAIEGSPLYGFGAMGGFDVALTRGEDGKVSVAYAERAALPTAAQIEAAYDHSRHPSPFVAQATAKSS
jgi:hypothetical protein